MPDKPFKKRILFLGMPDMALVCFDKIFRAGVNIVGVVPPAVSNPGHNFFISFLKKYNVNIITFDKSLQEKDFLVKIQALEADLAVVCSFNRKFPPELLKLTKDGFINCHPSLLPYYRGANPYSHIIKNDESTSGVTIHFMDESFDTGDIVYQREFDLVGNETMGTLFNVTNYIAAEMLLETLVHYENKGTLFRYPQKHLAGSSAPSIEANNFDNLIDWKQSAKKIDCFVRALNPFIIATSNFRDSNVRIVFTSVDNTVVKEPPGTICETKKGLGVATENGILFIEILQYGTYLITTGLDFVKRYNVKKGECFY